MHPTVPEEEGRTNRLDEKGRQLPVVSEKDVGCVRNVLKVLNGPRACSSR